MTETDLTCLWNHLLYKDYHVFCIVMFVLAAVSGTLLLIWFINRKRWHASFWLKVKEIAVFLVSEMLAVTLLMGVGSASRHIQGSFAPRFLSVGLEKYPSGKVVNRPIMSEKYDYQQDRKAVRLHHRIAIEHREMRRIVPKSAKYIKRSKVKRYASLSKQVQRQAERSPQILIPAKPTLASMFGIILIVFLAGLVVSLPLDLLA